MFRFRTVLMDSGSTNCFISRQAVSDDKKTASGTICIFSRKFFQTKFVYAGYQRRVIMAPFRPVTCVADKTLRACVIGRCAGVALLRACTGYLTSTLDVVCALLTQPCWWYRPLDVQHSVTVPSQWLWHVRGTACRRLSGMHRR